MSVNDPDDPFGGLCYAQVVGDHDDGVAHIIQFPEQFQYFSAAGLIQSTGRLVRQNDIRIVDQCPCVQSIEVNSADGLDFSCEVKEVPRKPMFDSLSEADRKKLADIFLPDVHDESALHGTLILTQPFADDGLMSLERQKEIFAVLSRSYPDAVIKPHPRDIADYSDLGCPMLPKNVPFEVIEMCCSPHYSLAVSVSSTAVNGLRCADEKLQLGMDHIK